jgi:hypothetical protein
MFYSYEFFYLYWFFNGGFATNFAFKGFDGFPKLGDQKAYF